MKMKAIVDVVRPRIKNTKIQRIQNIEILNVKIQKKSAKIRQNENSLQFTEVGRLLFN